MLAQNLDPEPAAPQPSQDAGVPQPSADGGVPQPSADGGAPQPSADGGAPQPSADGGAPQPSADGGAPQPSADGGGTQPSSPSLEIANAMARLHKQFVGRGPVNSRVTIDGDLVVCLLEGGYTKAEQTLGANDRTDIVAAGRLGLQDAMSADLVAAVENTLGRRVRSFMSANDLQENLQIEVFVLHDGMPRRDRPPED